MSSLSNIFSSRVGSALAGASVGALISFAFAKHSVSESLSSLLVSESDSEASSSHTYAQIDPLYQDTVNDHQHQNNAHHHHHHLRVASMSDDDSKSSSSTSSASSSPHSSRNGSFTVHTHDEVGGIGPAASIHDSDSFCDEDDSNAAMINLSSMSSNLHTEHALIRYNAMYPPLHLFVLSNFCNSVQSSPMVSWVADSRTDHVSITFESSSQTLLGEFWCAKLLARFCDENNGTSLMGSDAYTATLVDSMSAFVHENLWHDATSTTNKFTHAIRFVEEQFGKRGSTYLVGPYLSLADILLWSVIQLNAEIADLFERVGSTEYPKLSEWHDSLSSNCLFHGATKDFNAAISSAPSTMESISEL
jgi:Glutathione S-transferase, C-terminal domain